MNEKGIIKSENYNTTKFAIIMFILGIIAAFVVYINILGYLFVERMLISIAIFGGCAFFGVLVHFIFSKIKLTVTDKRIYGTTLWGKRVDLPLDSVSAVGTAWIKSITVSTSSGRISFSLMKNLNELHSEISKLLVERQRKTNEMVVKQEIPQSNADELKKYKNLLDSGIITQEEFEAKKKQLLAL